jgi:hypothetical protein
MDNVIESLPQAGHLQVNIQLQADVNYSRYAARRKVSRFVGDEISYLLRGGEPILALTERICWRVPVVLTLPPKGSVGTVGAIDVDVETGQLYTTPQQISEISRHAEALAIRQTSATDQAS